ncbi:hypothetical protein [Natronobiforma cellulositropha]|uniref:hypothetical protein n=1 Tax=Natronobiforma cellulositropha TaxID=1679076 RepID=UPI0021D5C700|nr:hypothetical protein [Natronobiforma cellulositropha]
MFGSPTTQSNPDQHIASLSFERTEPTTVETGPAVTNERTRGYEPSLTVDRATRSLRVTGRLVHGSKDCTQVRLASTAYEAETATFTATISEGRTMLGRITPGCTDAEGEDGYRLTVEFDDAPPKHVTVTERDHLGGEFEGEWTIDEQ